MLGLELNFISNGILFICTIFGFTSFLPQIIKTIKIKKSDDISVLSWVIWIITYILFTIYAFVFTVDIVLFIFTALEGMICLFTLLICLKYRSYT